jgi:hypothetical protein
MMRKKLAIIAAATLPLTGAALFGGIQAASAGGGPLLTCTTLGPAAAAGPAGGVTFNGGTTGISLASNASQAALLTAVSSAQITAFETSGPLGSAQFVGGVATSGAATNGNTVITINKGVVAGQTLSVAGFTGTYVVASDIQVGAGVVSPDQVTLTTPLAGGVAVKGIVAKAKAAVTVNATDGTNNTTAYNPSVTEDIAVTASNCTSSTGLPGSFAPTQVDVDASSPATNSASGLELPPTNLDGSVVLPAIGADYVQPVATSINFDTAADNKLNLGDFDLTYAKGVIAGDYATTKGALNISALNPMVVCTQGELQAIAGSGPDHGTIATGANPLVVCDSGSAPAYPSGNGLSEILGAELSPGSTVTGGDGTDIAAIYEIQVTAGGNAVL